MLLSKEQILNADDRRFEDVAVPEWGGSVRIAEMSGLARNNFEMSLIKEISKDGTPVQDLSNISNKLLAVCIVDENFKPLFTVDELSDKNNRVLNRLYSIAERLNAVTQTSVEDAAKN